MVISRSPTNPRHLVQKRVLGKGGDVLAVPKAGGLLRTITRLTFNELHLLLLFHASVTLYAHSP